MSILKEIKRIKDIYTGLRLKAEEKMSVLSKNKDESSINSYNFWNGVRLNCKSIESDLKFLEVEVEMTLQSLKIDLSALKGE